MTLLSQHVYWVYRMKSEPIVKKQFTYKILPHNFCWPILALNMRCLANNPFVTPTLHYVYRHIYRVVQKTDTQFNLGDNFSNSAPILTILTLLQAEIYGA